MDEDIDFSDLPEIPPEAFVQAIVRKALRYVLEFDRHGFIGDPGVEDELGERAEDFWLRTSGAG